MEIDYVAPIDRLECRHKDIIDKREQKLAAARKQRKFCNLNKKPFFPIQNKNKQDNNSYKINHQKVAT